MKYLFKLSVLIITIFSIGCNTVKSDTNQAKELPDDYSKKIDSIINTESPRIFNGVILITKNGEVKYSKAKGYSNFEDKTPIKIKDKFRIQSNSKQVTAVLILREVEKGKINLQDPIIKYLPDFNQTWANTVTVHQLLNMSSGIVDLYRPLIFEPGKGYKYSNPGYGLLGRIIEAVTGKEYIDQANSLFKELGMNESYCYELDKSNEGLINGYWLKNEKMELVNFARMGFTDEEWKDFIPCGGIISNAEDLNIWDSKLHKGEILKSEYYKQMVTPTNEGPHAAFDNETIGYAYGLRIHDKNETKHIGHGGRGIGFVSIKFYVPEKDVDVIIWENIYSRESSFSDDKKIYHFENEIRKIIMNSNLVQ